MFDDTHITGCLLSDTTRIACITDPVFKILMIIEISELTLNRWYYFP